MKKLFIFSIVFVLASGIAGVRAQTNGSLNADLNRLMSTFDKPRAIDIEEIRKKMPNIYDASGTLFFFDNAGASQQKMSPQEMKANLFKDMIRARVQKKKSSEPQEQTFSRLQERQNARKAGQKEQSVPQTASKTKLMRLVNYDGPTIAAAIPPDTYVEAPFVSHYPYLFARIDILGNGSIKVTETVERIVGPDEHHFTGIDRAFSKYNLDRAGRQTRASLIPLEAQIDGVAVSPVLAPVSGGIRLSIRQKAPLEPGVHLMTYSYLFEDKIASYDNKENKAESFKELVWNVTGANFDFPVMRAGATVIYPEGADILTRTGMSGSGATLQEDLRIKRDDTGDTSYVLTYPLAPYEHFIIVTSWAEPNTVPVYDDVLDRFLRNHGTSLLSFVAFLFIGSYYLATWISLKKGQLKKKSAGAPLKKDDLSPAVIHFDRAGKAGPKALFILLLALAGKGFLKFSEENGKITLIKATDDMKKLSVLEKTIAKKLFPKDATSLPLTAENALKLKRLLALTEKRIKREHALKFISFESGYFWFGILMAVIAFATISSLSLFPALTAKTGAFCIAFFIPLYYAVRSAVPVVKNGLWRDDKKALIVPALFAVAFAAALTRSLLYFAEETTFFTAFWLTAVLICCAISYSLFRTKSLLGNTLTDSMEAYAAYLTNQDDTLLSTMRNTAFKIKALYAKHLPFAVALNVEREWTKRFASFDQAQGDLAPDWYQGPAAFDENFVGALYGAFSTVFPDPKTARRSSRPARSKK